MVNDSFLDEFLFLDGNVDLHLFNFLMVWRQCYRLNEKFHHSKLVVELLPNTSIKEEHLLYLECLDEKCHDATLDNETDKKHFKYQYEKYVCPQVFSSGDLFLFYEHDHDTLGEGNFEPLWHGPYIFKHVFKRGAYEIVEYDGNPLLNPHNALYHKNYYAYPIWPHDALYIGVF
jgi:hypothetical protein